MKKLLLLPLLIIQLLFLSCNNEILSPLNNVQISDHILPEFFVTSIAFDNKGTVWVGTFDNGLVKYHSSVTHYTSKNSSLPDNLLIWEVVVDKIDNVWLASNKGLIKFDNTNFHIYNKSNSPLITDNVFSLAVDKDNTLWFTSYVFREGGLMKYDGTTWTLYSPQNSQLPASLINDIFVDNRNNKWITVGETVNNGCIIRINNENWTLFGKEDIGFNPYFPWRLSGNENQIHASIDYRLSSQMDMNRPNIISYNGNQWKINNPVNEEGESLGYVGEIAVDLNGNLWAETYKYGIAVYDGKKWYYNKSELSVQSGIFDISIDRKNNIWIGSGDGIYIIK
jgi:ligand-binding sensor domain-containing protein